MTRSLSLPAERVFTFPACTPSSRRCCSDRRRSPRRGQLPEVKSPKGRFLLSSRWLAGEHDGLRVWANPAGPE